MTSCDTNVLLYYLNSDCREHKKAAAFLSARFEDGSFAVCELVLCELYVLLRTPAVLSPPLSAPAAADVVEQLRSNPHWRLIDYPGGLMDPVWKSSRRREFPRRAVFDARLALTLLHHGVTEFATRNTRDFLAYPFKKLWDPVE